MLRNTLLLGGSVAVLVAAIAAAEASTLSTDTWYGGSFGSTAGVGLYGGMFGGVAGTSPPDGNPTAPAPDTPWTFTLSKPGLLTVVDVGTPGDQFTLTFTGATTGSGTTSTPAAGATNVGQCISCAMADPDFSRGTFVLNAGTTTFNGFPVFMRAPGTFDFEVTNTVPESSTWAMMLLGFAGLGIAGYRRAKNGAGRRFRPPDRPSAPILKRAATWPSSVC